MSTNNTVPFNWDSENDNALFGSLFPDGLSAPNFGENNSNSFEEVRTNKGFEEMSAFKNSPFGQYWEKNLPDWALPYFGPAKVSTTSNIKFVDISQTLSQSDANFYQKLLGEKVKPYEYYIYYASEGDGDKVLANYNDPNIKPKDNEVIVFIEFDDGKFDFGKIVRVKLGANVVKDMQFKFTEDYLSDDELAAEIIRKINLLGANNAVVKDIKNSKDFNNLLTRAIDYEYNNKKFDEFSYLLLFTNGLEFFEFKSFDWLKDASHWLRQRKYEDEKYWNGHLTKGFEPAFLPTSLFVETKQEREKIINQLTKQPSLFIDEFIETHFKEKTPLSNFFEPKIKAFKNLLDETLKPFINNLIAASKRAEGFKTFLKFCNAFWVGVWNGIIEFIASIIDLIGIIILVLKNEIGFTITDALWEKIENLCNFVYYETQKFFDLILDKAITFLYQVYYLDFNGYKVAKEIGELIPDIVTIMISWLKASKLAKVGSIATATEEIATKEVLEKLEKEGVEEAGEKAVKEVEEKLDDLVGKGKPKLSPKIVTGRYSERTFDINNCGGKILDLTWKDAKITKEGIDIIKKHLGRLEYDEWNVRMIKRLEKIEEGKFSSTDFDNRFYTHEIREYERYKNLGFESTHHKNIPDEVWDNAHAATLEDYKLHEKMKFEDKEIYSLFHPEVQY